ncbi:ATP-binding cassette transporter [Clonorchis sinensis]|uniref:ATP-binding cassette transporter n=1 Tax=Clonorchis sinensis TaxID=79923 RepID=G7YP45_CLOSI|nr:ATP-binding cassette transporter [Clonorchis sinensis]
MLTHAVRPWYKAATRWILRGRCLALINADSRCLGLIEDYEALYTEGALSVWSTSNRAEGLSGKLLKRTVEDGLHVGLDNRSGSRFWLSGKSWLYCGEASLLNTDIMLSMVMIMVRSAYLIAVRKVIPATSDYNSSRRSLKYRIIKSLKDDGECWWIANAQELEKAFAAGNGRALFQLIRLRRQVSAKRYAGKTERQSIPKIVFLSDGLNTPKISSAGLLQHNSWKNPAGLNGTSTPVRHQQQESGV